MELSGKGIGNSLATPVDATQETKAKIPRRTFEEWKLQDPTDYYVIQRIKDCARQMAKQVTAEIDKTIIQGWTSENGNEVKGFFKIAGLSHPGHDFGTYGGAQDTVAEGIKQLMCNHIHSRWYNLVINPEQYNELFLSEKGPKTNEFAKVIHILNQAETGGPGKVYATEHLDPGTGFISPVANSANMVYYDLIEAQQPKHYLMYANGDKDLGDIILSLKGAVTPRFGCLNPDGLSPAVCKFTDI